MPEGRCPDFIWNTLEVSGPTEAVHDFLNAAAGPGFLDIAPDWYGVYEQTYYRLLRGGAPTKAAAARLAGTMRDRLWWAYERERSAAERDPRRCAFDLNALIPVPATVLRAGLNAVAEWCWQQWGTRVPPQRVSHRTTLRRAGGGMVRQVYIFTFLTEDWSPWLAVAAIRRRWPGLRFELRAAHLELTVDRRQTIATAGDRPFAIGTGAARRQRGAHQKAMMGAA